jgi:hypothetical protein
MQAQHYGVEAGYIMSHDSALLLDLRERYIPLLMTL